MGCTASIGSIFSAARHFFRILRSQFCCQETKELTTNFDQQIQRNKGMVFLEENIAFDTYIETALECNIFHLKKTRLYHVEFVCQN